MWAKSIRVYAAALKSRTGAKVYSGNEAFRGLLDKCGVKIQFRIKVVEGFGGGSPSRLLAWGFVRRGDVPT